MLEAFHLFSHLLPMFSTEISCQSPPISTQIQSVRIGILGVGRWGSHLLRNFLNHPSVTVKAVIDPCIDNLVRAKEWVDETNTVQWLTDWQAMFAVGLDAIVVATPAKTHYPIIKAALQQGIHVLAEKPLTLTTREARELCDLAEKFRVQLVVDHTYLFHPAVLRGKIALDENAIGTLRYGYATRTHLGPVRQDVDVLWDLAIHDLAILNHWVGDRPSRVSARGSSWLQNDTRTTLSLQGLADTVWATLTYPSGFSVDLHFSWLNGDKQRRMAIVGDQGTLVFDELAEASLVIQQGYLVEGNGVKGDRGFAPKGPEKMALAIANQEPLAHVCDHFIHCVLHNQPSRISSGWLGADLVTTLVGLSESMNRDGEWVSL